MYVVCGTIFEMPLFTIRNTSFSPGVGSQQAFSRPSNSSMFTLARPLEIVGYMYVQ